MRRRLWRLGPGTSPRAVIGPDTPEPKTARRSCTHRCSAPCQGRLPLRSKRLQPFPPVPGMLGALGRIRGPLYFHLYFPAHSPQPSQSRRPRPFFLSSRRNNRHCRCSQLKSSKLPAFSKRWYLPESPHNSQLSVVRRLRPERVWRRRFAPGDDRRRTNQRIPERRRSRVEVWRDRSGRSLISPVACPFGRGCPTSSQRNVPAGDGSEVSERRDQPVRVAFPHRGHSGANHTHRYRKSF